MQNAIQVALHPLMYPIVFDIMFPRTCARSRIKENAMIRLPVGNHFTYAFLEGWRMVCQVPTNVALDWLLKTAPNAKIFGLECVTVAMARAEAEFANLQWHDKVAAIVENTSHSDIALYMHEGICYVVEKDIK